jgi:hypothetical protein
MAEVLLADRKRISAKGSVKFFGVHHLALNTDDMKMTVDFYVGVLGMRLVHAMKVPPAWAPVRAIAAIHRSSGSATIFSIWDVTGC